MSLYTSVRPALMIARRETRDQFRDWRIIFPILGLTVFFPFLMNFTASQILGFVNRYGATIVGERLVPFLLMIVGFFPISVSLVIALETFVGEKERGSIEPLLNTPLKDWQLYLGKLLAATVPPLFSSFVGMAVYMGGLRISHIPLPQADLLILIFVLTIVQAVVMVAGAVVVSSQATSVRAANLLASFIIIPIAMLVQGESVMMFWGDYRTLWWAVFGLLVLGVLLVRVGLAHFQREELLGREIDVLNLKWGWGVFWRTFRGGARSLWEWYGKSIPATLHRMRRGIWIVCLLLVAGVLVGWSQTGRFFIPLDADANANMAKNLRALLPVWTVGNFAPVLAIWWQNVRVLLLAMLLGAVSMGILGVIPLVGTMAAAGYLMGLLTSNGLPFINYLLMLAPHGVLEIPAAVIATAAVLQAGAVLATPTPGRTVGEVYLTALAEWARLMVGVVIPLLLLAAFIEAWITPRVMLALFGG